jgi:Uncharacterized protein conserved in bacteria
MIKRNMLIVLGVCALAMTAGVASAAEGAPVLMVGDSMMRQLGVAMEKELKIAGIQPASAFSSLGSGLTRVDAFDWFGKIESLIQERKPKVVVITIGTNDRQPLKAASEGMISYGTPEWSAEYARYVGRIMDLLVKGSVEKVIWLLLPDMKDASHQEYAQTVNAIFAREATATDARKEKVVLFDMRPILARKPGTYSAFVMSPNGQAVTVRDADGVHLAAMGAQRVAQALVTTYWKK